ncbi:MAG TPA: FCD domain-containing protein [Sphingomonadaceae bacterium]|nr:FCD domain-containing protein [Sphingomonadaceae bacterium]
MARNVVGLTRARVQSLSSGIVEQVLDALFSGKLKPGQFLGTEAQLSETFQTSRVPIREALGQLAALGVITIRTGARGGATIAEGDPEQFAVALAVQFMLVGVSPEEIFDIRIAIESRAAEMAATKATDEDIATLREYLAAIPTGKAARRAATEKILEFHSAVVEVSGSRTLITLMNAIKHALLNLYVASTPDMRQPALAYSTLEGIVERIAAHDPEGARAAMAAHLAGRREALIERLEKIPHD